MSAASVAFRRASRNDVPAIVDLLAHDALGTAREVRTRPLDPRYYEAFDAIARDRNQFLAAADHRGDVVGCLQLTFIPGLSRTGMWRGQIEGVRIAESHRSAGLGRRFIEWAIETCRQHQCGLVQLTSDKSRNEALRFYESLGFRASHEGFKLHL